MHPSRNTKCRTILLQRRWWHIFMASIHLLMKLQCAVSLKGLSSQSFDGQSFPFMWKVLKHGEIAISQDLKILPILINRCPNKSHWIMSPNSWFFAECNSSHGLPCSALRLPFNARPPFSRCFKPYVKTFAPSEPVG